MKRVEARPKRLDSRLKPILDDLYSRYNRPEYITPDPLQFVVGYPDVRDREIAGMIASSLAFGNIAQILRSISGILDTMTRPCSFLLETDDREIRRRFAGFRHRFVSDREFTAMLIGVKRAINRHGSLHGLFAHGMRPEHDSVLPALEHFVQQLRAEAGRDLKFLLPSPRDGSACKRLLLFLRWMVRHDAVDPGGWVDLSAEKLVVPLDTHLFRIARQLGFTDRKQANLRTALEVTEAFRRICPEDPVKYDFVLTRFGIHPKLSKQYRQHKW
ncbi:MAG: TIGR02757 family protein [Candidatus Hydrogenedentes bacterium]|nr:TIGR02757 family protein [Candidatus Hydrogenedentota bacterium]